MLLAMPIAHFSGSFVCSALSIFRRDLTVSGHAEPDFMRRIHRFNGPMVSRFGRQRANGPAAVLGIVSRGRAGRPRPPSSANEQLYEQLFARRTYSPTGQRQ